MSIRVMHLWKNGTITSMGWFTSLFWAMRSIRSSAFTQHLWIEDEKKPATKVGHS